MTDAASVAAVVVVAGVAVVDLTAQIFPLPDGGLQVEWHYHDWDLEIEIDAGGGLYVYARDDAGQVHLDVEAADAYDMGALASARQFLGDALDLHPRPAD